MKYYSKTKTDLNIFEKNTNKVKILFQDTKIYWLEIYSDEKIESSRPNTKVNIDKFNTVLKKNFKQNFIKLGQLTKKKYFTRDGYHLNRRGHLELCDKIIKFLK